MIYFIFLNFLNGETWCFRQSASSEIRAHNNVHLERKSDLIWRRDRRHWEIQHNRGYLFVRHHVQVLEESGCQWNITFTPRCSCSNNSRDKLDRDLRRSNRRWFFGIWRSLPLRYAKFWRHRHLVCRSSSRTNSRKKVWTYSDLYETLSGCFWRKYWVRGSKRLLVSERRTKPIFLAKNRVQQRRLTSSSSLSFCEFMSKWFR